jgi:hypothetical protein
MHPARREKVERGVDPSISDSFVVIQSELLLLLLLFPPSSSWLLLSLPCTDYNRKTHFFDSSHFQIFRDGENLLFAAVRSYIRNTAVSYPPPSTIFNLNPFANHHVTFFCRPAPRLIGKNVFKEKKGMVPHLLKDCWHASAILGDPVHIWRERERWKWMELGRNGIKGTGQNDQVSVESFWSFFGICCRLVRRPNCVQAFLWHPATVRR